MPLEKEILGLILGLLILENYDLAGSEDLRADFHVSPRWKSKQRCNAEKNKHKAPILNIAYSPLRTIQVLYIVPVALMDVFQHKGTKPPYPHQQVPIPAFHGENLPHMYMYI